MFNCRFHTCFGFLSFWDWIYGTDQDFENSVQSDRHIRQEQLEVLSLGIWVANLHGLSLQIADPEERERTLPG